MERVMIFIDGSNFYHGLREEFEIKKEEAHKVPAVDFSKFGNFLCGSGRKLEKIHYYNAPLSQNDKDKEAYKEQQRFFNSLQFVPNLIFTKGRLEKRYIKIEHKGIAKIFGKESVSFHVEKGIDVNIAVDMLKLAFANQYDTAILVSGDGDFASVVEAVKNLGKKVECAYVSKRKCYHLKQVANKFISLDKKNLVSCLVFGQSK
jgi:uncharacterized LabA/DUF88 family protein